MSVINPKRILTLLGRKLTLAHLAAASGAGPFNTKNVFVVTDAQVDSFGDVMTSVTLGDHGLQIGVPLAFSIDPTKSATGKVYMCSDLMAFQLATPIAAQTVVGIVIGGTGTTANVLAYLQLDDPITVDEDLETIQLAVEFGYDDQDWYLTPRVLPAGV